MFPNFVVLLFLNPQSEILLLRRINTLFSNNHYTLPGGKIELGESVTQAAIREAKNSLGIEIAPENLRMVHLMSRKCNEPEFLMPVFQVIDYKGELCNGEPARHDDMQWFASTELPSLVVSAHRHAIEMINKGVLYSEHGWESYCN